MLTHYYKKSISEIIKYTGYQDGSEKFLVHYSLSWRYFKPQSLICQYQVILNYPTQLHNLVFSIFVAILRFLLVRVYNQNNFIDQNISIFVILVICKYVCTYDIDRSHMYVDRRQTIWVMS